MAISRNKTRDKVWNFLRELGMNEYGASGFMGNLYSESAVSPNCVEELLAQRYNEDSTKYKNIEYIQGYKRPVNTASNISYNSQMYTGFIDSGIISKDEFLHPRSYTGVKHQYGYGLVQWTTEARKKRLWANTVDKGKSIADLDGQLQTLKQELTGTYKNVLQACRNAKSVDEASDYVLVHFESPANAEELKATRRSYSQQFYALYHVNVVKRASDLDVDDFLVAVKAVCDYARTHNYKYGDSHATPPTADGIISCDRMFARALWDRGFTDQPVSTATTSGITNGNMDSYLTSHEWQKSTSFNDIRKGSIVQVHNMQGALHCFVVVGYDAKNNTFTKYDCGSKQRIDTVQPFRNEKWQYRDLVAVYNIPAKESQSWKATGTAICNTDALNVREKANVLSKVVTVLHQDNRFEVDGKTSGKWVHCNVGDVVGWVSKNYIKFDNEKKEEVKQMGYDVNKVINQAQKWVGYMEKRSNSQLESKTANAGSGNFTYFWKIMKPSFQGQSWCSCWVDFIFRQAYGESAANYLQCGGNNEYYTPTAAQYYKNKGQWHTGSDVRRGDQIFFKNSQRIHHTGLVVDVKNGRVFTIQGNTSNGTAVVPNGGQVCAKSYPIGLSTIAGYGRPNYGAQSTITSTPQYDYHSIYDDAYYKAKYPDVAKVYGAKNAYEHYATYGVKEGRSPSAKFSPQVYRNRYPDLDKAYGNNWEGYAQHYITFAAKEGRNGAEDPKPTNLVGKVGTVTTPLNVRVNAGVSYPKCTSFGPLPTGTKIQILKQVKGTDGDQWYFIRYQGKEGYVSAKYVK